jgi:hypothetical protein
MLHPPSKVLLFLSQICYHICVLPRSTHLSALQLSSSALAMMSSLPCCPLFPLSLRGLALSGSFPAAQSRNPGSQQQ